MSVSSSNSNNDDSWIVLLIVCIIIFMSMMRSCDSGHPETSGEVEEMPFHSPAID